MTINTVLRAKDFVERWDSSNKGRIGVVFSAFDCMHAGHMIMLRDASNQCDHLVAGLQTDPTLDRSDTKNKPIMSLEERYQMLSGCKFVDSIFVYDTEAELYDFLKSFDWDVRILGSDWEGKQYTGCDIQKGEIYFHKRDHDFSSTNIRKKIFDVELAKMKD